ncbi:MAG TPA: Gfo/Idh/MocA family oxidoreductase [Planctomycetota bacterium]|jgi:predicted dehydrogenase
MGGDAASTKRSGGISRRAFVAKAAAAVAAFNIIPRHVLGEEGKPAASSKITLAGIGMGGQGLQDLAAFLEFPEIQVVAVCDVHREADGFLSWNWGSGKEQRSAGREPARKLTEERYAKDKPSGTYKGCKAYSDYRELLDKEDVDAVIVATPDHTHAVITMAALKKKKHVYCEKPMTYTVQEARMVAEEAKRAKVATQLGNQGQASQDARLEAEYIMDGAIGAVRQVDVQVPARFWAPALFDGRPKETPPVPDGLDWDLWLGPAPQRAYHPAYHPWVWRNWWDFGTGLLGDMGCHRMSSIFKALKLAHPITVEASCSRDNGENYPMGVIVHWEFPARGDMPPLTLNWYDGGLKPIRPKELEADRGWGGVIYYGDKGVLMDHRIIPEAAQRRYGKPPEKLPRSPGHQKEFVDACRGGAPAGANFVDHAGLLTETCLLGNVALRSGKKLAWDGPAMKVTSDTGANRFLHREYRAGWSL